MPRLLAKDQSLGIQGDCVSSGTGCELSDDLLQAQRDRWERVKKREGAGWPQIDG